MAIDKLAEDIFEQIQRNMLIDIIYRSRREIEDVNKEIQAILQNLADKNIIEPKGLAKHKFMQPYGLAILST